MVDILKGELNQVLTFIGLQIEADPLELIAFANEDDLGGYHVDPTQSKFPMGSLWGSEGKILYALIRWLKPETVVEIGGWAGASASHLALAVERNGGGKVISVDSYIGDSLGTVGAAHGALIPAALKKWVTLVNEDGRVWLAKQAPQSIGFIFEDADHSTGLVMELSRLALQKLVPGGILANHDAGHDYAFYPNGQRTPSGLAQSVHDGLAQAGAPFKAYLAAPSDCGLAISRMATELVSNQPMNPVQYAAPGSGFPEKDPYAKMFETVVPQKPEEVAEKTVFPKPRDFISGTPIAPIESESEPPPVLQAQEQQTPAPKTIKKPIAKKKPAGKKKPTTSPKVE